MRGVRWGVLAVGIVLAAALPFRRAGANNGDAPKGYRVLSATDFGRAIATQKAGVSSLQTALQATLRDLTQYFGASPDVKGAYEEAKDTRSGGAKFVVTAGGRPLQGFILCKIAPAGADIAVVYAGANTPPAEWKRLTRVSAPGAGTTSPAAANKAGQGPPQGAAHVPLLQYRFPDGTGTIGLAEGWHTNTQSEMTGVVVNGPGDQLMLLGIPATVLTPNSQMVRMQRQYPVRGGPGMLVAPFTTPLEVFKIVVPQLSRASMRQGGPGFSIDDAVLIKTYKANLPGGRAAQFSVGVTERNKHYKALVQIEIDPVPPESFTMFQTAFRAPDATFDRDLPVMMEMANSLRENAQVITRKSNQQIAAKQRWFQDFQRGQREKSQAFDRQLHENERASNERLRQVDDNERASNNRLRSSDDADEYIRGVRTVEDTRTGEKTSVDLGDVDRIVDGLNEHDPDRYRQIPLRDEAHPLQ